MSFLSIYRLDALSFSLIWESQETWVQMLTQKACYWYKSTNTGAEGLLYCYKSIFDLTSPYQQMSKLEAANAPPSPEKKGGQSPSRGSGGGGSTAQTVTSTSRLVYTESACVPTLPHTSAYVSICQHTSAYVSMHQQMLRTHATPTTISSSRSSYDCCTALHHSLCHRPLYY